MLKNDFYNLHADVCKTISNPNRQAILDMMRSGEITVTELVNKTGIAQANLSQHLAILRSKGVVNTRRDGNNIYYSISNMKIIQAYDLISEVLQESFQNKRDTVVEAMEGNSEI